MPEHQDIIAVLDPVLRRFIRLHKLGRLFNGVDVFLPDGRGYIPDLCFVSAERSDLLSPKDHKIHGAPDLVVEVTSGTPSRDRVRKLRGYLANSVPWYWIIDGEALTIEEYRATPDGYLLTGSIDAGEEFHPGVFPGLVVHLAELVAEAT